MRQVLYLLTLALSLCLSQAHADRYSDQRSAPPAWNKKNGLRVSIKGTLMDSSGTRLPNQHVAICMMDTLQEIGNFVTDDHGNIPRKTYVYLSDFWKREVVTVFVLYESTEPFPNLPFMRGREEEGKATVCIPLCRRRVDLGDIYAHVEPIGDEDVPLKYTSDITTASTAPTLMALQAQMEEKADVSDTYTPEDIIQAFGYDRVALTKENTYEFITNGTCPIHFKLEGGFNVAHVDFSDYEMDDLDNLPQEVKLFYSEPTPGQLELEQIDVRFAGDEEATSYKPDDENFTTGLRQANCALFVEGQTVYHLSIGHVYGVLVAEAAAEMLDGHPLGDLILPHSRYIRKISKDLGRTAIFEEGGILPESGLTPKGVADLIGDTVGGIDPFSYEPRLPINDDNKLALAIRLHYENILEAVHRYFDEHWEDMVDEWGQVHSFFDRIFKRSAAYRPWKGESDSSIWRDARDIGAGHPDEELPERGMHEGVIRSIRPIATNSYRPGRCDRPLIERFVAHYISTVTGWHSIVHNTQKIYALDPNFAPIALFERGENPLKPIAESKTISQLMISGILTGFPMEEYSIYANPHEDVDQGIIDLIKEDEEEYREYGVEPETDLTISTVI